MHRHHIARRALLIAAIALVWTLAGCKGHPAPKLTEPHYRSPVGLRAHPPGWATQPPPQRFGAVPPQPTVEMFDTITLATVPANPVAVAGYTSGYWPTFGPLVRAYPNARHISIAIYGTQTPAHVADCLDVEPGDAPPEMVPGWVRWMQSLGHWRPCVYSSVSAFAESINGLLAQAGLSGAVRRWCAWYRYVPGLIQGCDAVQWTDHAFGRNLDESTVSLVSFFRQPAPPPKPPRERCFGAHFSHSTHCAVIRGRVAGWSRKIVVTRKALTAHGCWRYPAHAAAPQPCRGLFAYGDELHADIKRQLY